MFFTSLMQVVGRNGSPATPRPDAWDGAGDGKLDVCLADGRRASCMTQVPLIRHGATTRRSLDRAPKETRACSRRCSCWPWRLFLTRPDRRRPKASRHARSRSARKRPKSRFPLRKVAPGRSKNLCEAAPRCSSSTAGTGDPSAAGSSASCRRTSMPFARTALRSSPSPSIRPRRQRSWRRSWA